MVIHSGNARIYDNFNLGLAESEDAPFIKEDQIAIVFADVDNDVQHFFLVNEEQFGEYVKVLNARKGGPKLQVVGADQMPKGPINGA